MIMQKGRVKITQVAVDAVTQKEALEEIRLFLSSLEGHQVVTLNSEMIVRAERDEEFRRIVEAADLGVADGMGVLAAASYLRKKKGGFFYNLAQLLLMPFRELFAPDTITDALPEKISGIDLIHAICDSDFMAGKRLYLLGAGEGIAKRAGEILRERYPNILIAGAEEGTRKGFSEEENRLAIERINAALPDVLFVALGSPKQEKWIHENLPRLGSVRVAMGVGGSFDVISGKVSRAPKIFQRRGMEWLWRLIHEPRRLKRIYNASFRLAWLIFRDKEDKI